MIEGTAYTYHHHEALRYAFKRGVQAAVPRIKIGGPIPIRLERGSIDEYRLSAQVIDRDDPGRRTTVYIAVYIPPIALLSNPSLTEEQAFGLGMVALQIGVERSLTDLYYHEALEFLRFDEKLLHDPHDGRFGVEPREDARVRAHAQAARDEFDAVVARVMAGTYKLPTAGGSSSLPT